MKLLKKLHLLQILLLFNLILCSSIHHQNHRKYCGNITTQPPFLTSNSSIPSLLRISVNIPSHVPEFCKGCEKPNGSCGAGLNCLCHPKECSKYLEYVLKIFILFYILIPFFLGYEENM
jgi:hypothetical protein